MLLTDARRPARSGPDGELIPLAEQDRGRWDRRQITEGTSLLTEAMRSGHLGEYQLQAAIAALHDQAPSHDGTDWPRVLALYERLASMTGNPMVALNRAVAAAMVHGPAAGLDLLDGLGEHLGDHHRLHSVRAHLLEQAGERRRGDHRVPGRGRAHRQRARAKLPDHEGGPPRGRLRPGGGAGAPGGQLWVVGGLPGPLTALKGELHALVRGDEAEPLVEPVRGRA